MNQQIQLIRVSEAQVAKQLVATRQLGQLLDRQPANDIRQISTQIQSKHGRLAVFIQQTLNQQKIGKIEILDVIQKTIRVHAWIPCVSSYWHPLTGCFICLQPSATSALYDGASLRLFDEKNQAP
jgi:hypothetical protein